MTKIYVKQFEVLEGTARNMEHEITVYFGCQVVETIVKKTQKEAQEELQRRGYKLAFVAM